jgi:hypothetical protein
MKRWEVLDVLVKEHGWKYGAELGVLDGDVIFYLLEHNPDLKMMGVDLWEAQPPVIWKAQVNTPGRLHEGYKTTMIKSLQYPDRVSLLKMTTTEASAEVSPESLGFIFIDANHSFNAVLEDLENWYPLVKHGGWILGHDWEHKWPGVQKAVEHFISKHKINTTIALFDEQVWGFRKE